MLKKGKQMKISLYRELYDIVIPKNNILRKIKENIDFSFVNPMLRESYCENFGRPAKEPEMMFKLLFLKKLYDISDEVLIQNAKVNMAYKYFLDLDPEDDMINSSLLTKFRKTRITQDILEEMLKEIIKQAINKGLIKSNSILVDSTHTNAKVRAKKPTEVLREMTKNLRKTIYKEDYDLSSKFPDKPDITAELNEEIEYTKQLLNNIKEDVFNSDNKKLVKQYNKINELLENDKIRKTYSKDEKDAKFGHKTASRSFFGYKNHIAMTPERIITGLKVTSGEVSDDKYLIDIIEQSKENLITTDEIIGDTAYSSRNNIKYCNENNIDLIAPLNPVISNAANIDDEFIFNKDAKTMQCPSGELAISYRKNNGKYDNIFYTFYFSKVKCRRCPLKGQCKVTKNKTNTHSITITSNLHKRQIEFEKSEYFKDKSKIRMQIESKNSELKHHGLARCDSSGIFAIQLQSYFTAFVVNAKRIMKLSNECYE